MNFETIIVTEQDSSIIIAFNRPNNKNSINRLLLHEINKVLDYAESNASCRLVIFKGTKDFFCTGLDFEEVATLHDRQQLEQWGTLYTQTLRRFTESSKIIVSCIEGKAIAGGLGFVAASDWVIATDNAHFKLSEALWGLLPAMIAPYLIRRIGFQQTYSMTFTCRGVSPQEAQAIHLIDKLNNDVNEAIKRLSIRLSRTSTSTVKEMKAYFKKLYPISPSTEKDAIDEFATLLLKPEVQANIHRYLESGKLPWEDVVA